MEDPNHFDVDFDLLCRLAQQSWLDRGQAMASAGVDLAYASAELGLSNEQAPAYSVDGKLDDANDA